MDIHIPYHPKPLELLRFRATVLSSRFPRQRKHGPACFGPGARLRDRDYWIRSGLVGFASVAGSGFWGAGSGLFTMASSALRLAFMRMCEQRASRWPGVRVPEVVDGLQWQCWTCAPCPDKNPITAELNAG